MLTWPGFRNACHIICKHETLRFFIFGDCLLQRLPRDGYDIRTVQELLGHKDLATSMIYTHVLNKGGRGLRSSADKI